MRLLPSKKIIYGCDSRGDADSPYLTRYTLFKCPLGQLCVHVFHRSDNEDLHDHPWTFISLILWGGYIEEYLTPDAGGIRTVRKYRFPGRVLYRPAKFIHRVELRGGRPSVSLLWMGRRCRIWGFWLRSSRLMQWEKYFKVKGCK